MNSSTPLSSLRTRLAISTALVGGLLGMATAPARAQTVLPTGGAVVSGDVTITPPTGTGTQLSIDVGSSTGIVHWDSFSVVNGSVAFGNSSGGNAAILNRVVTNDPSAASLIDGAITGPDSLAVYLINPNGITFGTGANVNVGALIASSLDLTDDAAFTGLNGTLNFSGADGAPGVVVQGGQLRTTGSAAQGLGQLVLLGAQVTVEDGIQAASGDAAFVAGTDITMTSAIDSPLGFTIARGTQVRNAITANGTLSGRNVTLAFASQQEFTDSVLSVGGIVTATAAEATDEGILLVAGTSSSPRVTIAAAEGSEPDVESVGARVSIVRSGDVDLAANSRIEAVGDVLIEASEGAATVGGNVRAGGDYAVRGNSVTLGNGETAVTQSADGGVIATAAAGQLLGTAGLTLTANADGGGGDLMQLSATGGPPVENGIDFGAATLVGGADRSSRIGFFLGSDDAPLTIGTVDARGLYGMAEAESATFGDLEANSIRFAGPVSLRNILTARSTAGSILVDGTLSITGERQGLTLDAAQALTATAALDVQGDVALTAGTTLAVTTVVSNAGVIEVSGGEGTSGTRLQAAGSISETASDGAADILTLAAGVAGGTPPGGTDPAGEGDPTPDPSPVPTEANVQVTGLSMLKTLVSATGRNPGIDGNVDLTTTGGTFSVGSVQAGGAATLRHEGGTGELRADLVTATRALSIESGTAARIGTASTTGGALTVDAVTAVTGLAPATPGNGANLSGTSVSVTASAADSTALLGILSGTSGVDVLAGMVRVGAANTNGGAVNLVARGALSLGSASTATSGDVILTAGGALLATGGISSAGAYLVTGGTVELGTTAPVSQAARERVTITSTNGSIATRSGLRLVSNSADANGVGRSLVFSSAGDLSLADNSVLAGGNARTANVGIHLTGANPIVSIGGVEAAGLYGTDASGTAFSALVTPGALRLGGAISLRNGFVARTNSGDITVNGSLTVTGERQVVELDAARSIIATGAIGAQGRLALTANSGNVTIATAVASDGDLAITAAAGSTSGTRAQARGAIVEIADAGTGTAGVGTLVSGVAGPAFSAANPNAPASIFGASAAPGAPNIRVDGFAIAKQSVQARAIAGVGGNATLIASGGQLSLAGGSADGALTLNKLGEAGDVELAAYSAAGTITIGSDTAVRIGSIASTGGAIAIDAAGSVSGLVAATGGADLSATGTAGAIDVVAGSFARLGQVIAGDRISVDAGTLASIANAQSANALAVTADSIDFGQLTSLSGIVTLVAATSVSGTTLDGGAGVSVSGGDAGPAVEIADVRAATGPITLSGNQLALGTVTANDGAVTLTATTGNLSVGRVQAFGPTGSVSLATQVGDTLLSATSIEAAQGVVASGAGDLDIGTVLAGADIGVSANGSAALGLGNAGGSISVFGAVASVDEAIAGGDLFIVAGAGPASLGSGTIDGAATLQAFGSGGDVGVSGTLAAGGAVTIQAEAAATLGDVSGATTFVEAGEALTASRLAAAGEVTATGASIDIVRAEAGEALLLTALTGPLALGSGIAGTTATLDARGPAGTLAVAGLLESGGTATLLTAGTATLGTVGSGADILIDAGGALTAASLLAADSISAIAPSIAIGSATATAGTLSLAAGIGGLTLDSGVAGTTASVRSDGSVAAGTLASGSDAGVAAGTEAMLGSVTSGGTIDASAGTTLQAGTLVATNAVNGSGGTVDVGTANVGGALTLAAGTGGVTLGSGTAGTTATLTATGPIGLTGLLTSGGDATIATDTDAALATVDSGGTLTVNAAGTLQASALIAASDLAATGATAEIGSATATAGTLSLAAGAGGLTLGSGSAGTTASLTAAGPIVLTGLLTSGGNATIATDADATLATVTSADAITVNAGGALQATLLTAATDLAATGASVALGSATAGRTLALTAATGDLAATGPLGSGGAMTLRSAGATQLADATSGATLAIDAGGALAAATLTAAGDVTADAARIAIARAAAGGALALTARAGDLVLGSGSAGTTALLSATGTFTVVDRVDAGGGTTIRSGAGTTIGTIETAGSIDLASEGTLVATALLAGGDVLAAAGGGLSIDLARAAAGRIALTAGTDLALGSASAGTAATLASGGGTLVRDALTAGGAVTITAGGDARLARLTATGSGIAITAGGLLAGAAPGDGAILAAADGITVDAGRNATVATADAGGAIGIAAAAIDAGRVMSDGGPIDLLARTGSVTLGEGAAVTTALVRAADAATIGTLASGGAATLSAGGAAGIGSITSTAGDVTVTAATASVDRARAGGALSIAASGGDLRLADGAATGPATLTATGGIDVAALASGGPGRIAAGGAATLGQVRSTGADLALSAGGALTAAALAAQTGLAVEAASIAIDDAAAGASLTAVATGGDLRIGTGRAGGTATIGTRAAGGAVRLADVAAGGDVQVASAGDAAIGTLASSGGSLALAAAGALGGSEPAGRAMLSAAGAIDARAGATARIGSGEAGSTLTLVAGGIDANRLVAGTGALSATSQTGAIALGEGLAGTTATLRADGDATVGTLTAAQALLVSAGGAATLGTLRSTGGGIEIVAGSAAVDSATAATTLAATTTGGALAIGAGTAGGAITLVSAGDATFGTIASTGGPVVVDARSGRVTGTLSAAGSITVSGGSAVALGTLDSGGAVAIDADAISADRIDARGGALLLVADAGGIALGDATAAGAATLTASGVAAVTGTLRAGEAATVTAGSIGIGTAAAGTTLALSAQSGAITLATGSAGGAATLNAAGPVTVSEAIGTAGALTVAGSDIAIRSAAVGGAVSLTARAGTVRLDQATAGERLDVTASGRAVLGALGRVVSAGAVTVNAADIDIGAAGSTATDVRLEGRSVVLNNSGAGVTLLGGTADPAAGSFGLTAYEINRIATPELSFTSTGTARDVRVDALVLNGANGTARVNIFGTGRIDVVGAVTDSGSAAGRVLQIGGDGGVPAGGDPAGYAKAGVIRIAATADGGGRILLSDNVDLDLRGDRIGAGQDGGFLADIGLAPGGTPLSALDIVSLYVSRPSSNLYAANAYRGSNSQSSGAIYNQAQPNILTANRLTVRYTDFALFQNTAAADGVGASSGVRINDLQGPTLALGSTGAAAQNAFALFGTIAGRSGNSAALLGGTLIRLDEVNPSNSRINGCLIGSGGGGCLISSVVAPVVNVFDPAQANIFASAADLAIEFDPVVGTNNEALFSDLGTIDFQDDTVRCDPASDASCQDTTTEQ